MRGLIFSMKEQAFLKNALCKERETYIIFNASLVESSSEQQLTNSKLIMISVKRQVYLSVINASDL